MLYFVVECLDLEIEFDVGILEMVDLSLVVVDVCF